VVKALDLFVEPQNLAEPDDLIEHSEVRRMIDERYPG
jgi:hypothetical protein